MIAALVMEVMWGYYMQRLHEKAFPIWACKGALS
jgi:hypothetical protein